MRRLETSHRLACSAQRRRTITGLQMNHASEQYRSHMTQHMTQSSADKIANVIIGAAAVGAAVYVARTPHLRRVAWRLAIAALTGTMPGWLKQEIQSGWHESGGSSDAPPARARAV